MTTIATAAERLLNAERDAQPIDGLGGLIEPTSVTAGYTVQESRNALQAERGARPLGWKIGLTSDAIQRAFGASEPMRGVLYDHTRLPEHATLERAVLCAPRLEGEIVLKVGVPPPADADTTALLASIESVHAAFEIADSRYTDWRFGIGEAIADNACCGRFALVERGRSPEEVDWPAIAMSIREAGNAEPVSTGTAAACLGSPLNAYAWLVQSLAIERLEVRPGDLILTGALGPVVPLAAGHDYVVDLTGLGTLTIEVR